MVTISNGQVRGRVAKTFKNTTFYAFQEIPYATPPVGNLRFQVRKDNLKMIVKLIHPLKYFDVKY